MIESWNDYAKRKRKEFGVLELDIEIVLPKSRCVKPLKKVKPLERRFNIHKRSLPFGIDKIVVFNIESKIEAERIIKYTTNNQRERIFNTRFYRNHATDITMYVFYEVVPTKATLKERSIYFNSGDIVTESLSGYNGPTRVN